MPEHLPTMPLDRHPVSRIQWVDVNRMRANAYNPNVVQPPELKLLKHSILTTGWIQPILVNQEPPSMAQVHGFDDEESQTLEIIDGYHRWYLCKTDGAMFEFTGGVIPAVVMHLSAPERMLLTIRINRAKGNHVAVKMHEIVSTLHHKHGYSVPSICQGIGADPHEVNTLLLENLFKAKDVERIPYSKAWTPEITR